MFAMPMVRPFWALLAALRNDGNGMAAEHETKRRRWLLRERVGGKRASAPPAGWRYGELPSIRPSPRYALSRFQPVTFPIKPSTGSTQAFYEAATAV